jgi:hypothetical protein
MPNYVETDFMTVEELKQRNIWSTHYIAAIGLIPIVKTHNENLIGLEIGVCRGENTIKFIEECPNIMHIDCVDPYIEYMDDNGGMTQDIVDKMRAIAEKNFFGIDRVTLHNTTSKEFANTIEDKHYDLALEYDEDYGCGIPFAEKAIKTMLYSRGFFAK